MSSQAKGQAKGFLAPMSSSTKAEPRKRESKRAKFDDARSSPYKGSVGIRSLAGGQQHIKHYMHQASPVEYAPRKDIEQTTSELSGLEDFEFDVVDEAYAEGEYQRLSAGEQVLEIESPSPDKEKYEAAVAEARLTRSRYYNNSGRDLPGKEVTIKLLGAGTI
jgi:hypothetical protein